MADRDKLRFCDMLVNPPEQIIDGLFLSVQGCFLVEQAAGIEVENP